LGRFEFFFHNIKLWIEQLELLSFFIIELCLVEYKMLKFPPSLLAAAAIYTAQCSLYWFKQWSKTSEWHTSYTEDQLLWVFYILHYFNFGSKLAHWWSYCSYMPIGNAQEWWLVSIRMLELGNSLEFSGSTQYIQVWLCAAKAETALFLLGLWQCSQHSLPMEGVISACNWEHNYSLLNTFWAKKLQCLVYSRSYPIHLLCILRFWMKEKPGYFFERSNKIYLSLLSAYLSSSFVAAVGWKPDKQHILNFDWNCSTFAHKRSLD
jgi:hypothetical protein